MSITPFIPHPLVPGGQLQTLIGHLTSRPRAPVDYRVVPVHLTDGDQLLLHIDHPEARDSSRPVVVLMHGLGGCSESSYMLRISRKLTGLGYDVVRFNHRGCGRGAAKLARGIYHAGRVEDIMAALHRIGDLWPGRPCVAIAFSLSANMLLRSLGEYPDLDRTLPSLKRALAVCPPVDLEYCSQALSALRNVHIDRFYTRLLVQTARQRSKLFPDAETPVLPKRLNLRRFDGVFTAPLAGFKSLAEYYDTCSAKHFVSRVTTPTTVIAADDDPIIPTKSFEGLDFSPAFEVLMQKGGGHMGFLSREKTRFGDYRWMDSAVVDWVESLEK